MAPETQRYTTSRRGRVLHAFSHFLIVVSCCFLNVSTAQSVGLPPGWDKAVMLVEKRCSDMPSVPCSRIQTMPGDTSDCANFCKTPTDSCPVGFLDFCKTPTDYNPIATGFTLQLCGVTMLVSNRHVLSETQGDLPLFVRARLKSGEMIRLETGELHGHPNPKVDLAASRLRYTRPVKREDLVVGIIPEDAYRHQGKTTLAPLSAVRAGDQAVFAGFPLILGGVRALVTHRETPLIRSGVVSIVLPGTTQIGDKRFEDIFLVDSWAFLGNSGSPVILPPAFIKYPGDTRKKTDARLVGVVSAFLDVGAPIERAVVVGGVRAKVNSGLAVVQSLEGIESMVEQFAGAQCTPVATTKPDAPSN